jgi:hypothetical protein
MDRRVRDQMKYNEFHKGGQKEDRTTAEIIEIASKLEKGERISCTTWITPKLRLTIVLDNRPYERILDISLAFREAPFERPAGQGQRRINIVDIVEGFQLDDSRIDNQHPGAGYWTGWFLFHFQGPDPTEGNSTH